MAKPVSSRTVTYPLEDVMALAVMAQRINGDYLQHRLSQYDLDHNYIGAKHANKDLIKFGLGIIVPGTVDMTGNPDYYGHNVADEEDQETAREIIGYYTGLMFKAIGGKINDFEERVLGIVRSGVVAYNEIGVIASLPKSYARSVERETVEEQQRNLADSSKHVGQVGSTVELNISILRSNFIQKLACYVVNAVDDNNNLIVFFTGKDEFKTGESLEVRGRVKRHQTSNHHGGAESVLNYVKRI
jgi:hypothetical protein